MRRISILVLLLLPGAVCFAQASKPVVMAKDGFPRGHSTPEGAACDLARAFIKRDVALFNTTCVPPFGGGENRAAYEKFLKQTTQSIVAQSKKASVSPLWPQTITTVYAARHLSRSGPASYGYATFGFKDVQFVDVTMTLGGGKSATKRTLVLQNADGRWYVHPFPLSSPLLSDGLNQETASTQTITPHKP